jgi:transaldolase
MDTLERLGISYNEVTALLEREGLEKFEKSWAELLNTVSDELARVGTSQPSEAAK